MACVECVCMHFIGLFKLIWVVALAPSVWFSLVTQIQEWCTMCWQWHPQYTRVCPYRGYFKVGSLTCCILVHGDTGCYRVNSTQEPCVPKSLCFHWSALPYMSDGLCTDCHICTPTYYWPNTCSWMVLLSGMHGMVLCEVSTLVGENSDCLWYKELPHKPQYIQTCIYHAITWSKIVQEDWVLAGVQFWSNTWETTPRQCWLELSERQLRILIF